MRSRKVNLVGQMFLKSGQYRGPRRNSVLTVFFPVPTHLDGFWVGGLGGLNMAQQFHRLILIVSLH